jgi:hypothetical protein
MTLPDQNSSMVDALGEAKFKHLCLQATFQEIFNLEGEHVIESHACLVEHTNPHKTPDECIAFEQTLRVLVVELEQFTSRTADF